MNDKFILVLPREYIAAMKVDYGVLRMPVARIHALLREEGMYIDRAAAEKDPRYKQVIPYIMVRIPTTVPPLQPPSTPIILSYTRTKLAGEQRLRTKKSVGFGGHLQREEGRSAISVLAAGMRREIEEELRFSENAVPGDPQFCGIINDETNDVGQVHVGLLYVIDVEEKKADARLQVTTPDDNLAELKWSTPANLDLSEFEDWSVLAVQSLFPAVKES